MRHARPSRPAPRITTCGDTAPRMASSIATVRATIIDQEPAQDGGTWRDRAVRARGRPTYAFDVRAHVVGQERERRGVGQLRDGRFPARERAPDADADRRLARLAGLHRNGRYNGDRRKHVAYDDFTCAPAVGARVVVPARRERSPVELAEALQGATTQLASGLVVRRGDCHYASRDADDVAVGVDRRERRVRRRPGDTSELLVTFASCRRRTSPRPRAAASRCGSRRTGWGTR